MQITRGITGIWQISQNKNVSNAVPLKIRFFIPPTAYGMHHLPLSYSVQDFETYAVTTGKVTPGDTSLEVRDYSDNYDFYITGLQELPFEIVVAQATGGPPGGGNYTLNAHTHEMTASLDTTPADCNDISISIDGVDKTTELETKYGTLPTTDAQDLDLFEYLSAPILNAWHEIIIFPDGIGIPPGMCYIYAYLSPETVIKQV